MTSHRYRTLALLVALVCAVGVWLIATGLGIRLQVSSPLIGSIAISLPLVIGTSLVAGFLGWGLLALLERANSSARRTWTIIAIVALAISLLSITFLDATTACKTALAFLHLAVGLPLILMLRRAPRG